MRNFQDTFETPKRSFISAIKKKSFKIKKSPVMMTLVLMLPEIVLAPY